MENLYEILEVSPKASTEVIEKAYKALAKKYHPDTYKEDKRYASNMLKKINNAYDILGSEEKRREYDEQLEYQLRQEYNEEQEEEDDLQMNDIQAKPSFFDRFIEKQNVNTARYDKINRAIDEQYNKIAPKINNTVVVLILIGALVALAYVCYKCVDFISAM